MAIPVAQQGAWDDYGVPDAPKSPFALERRFDAAFIAKLALREKQVQQSYRPMIGIHKWFARRPGSLFRGLLMSEFGHGDLATTYWEPQDIRGVVYDPMMGGGTTVYEGLRLGLDVVARDVNPMAYWLVHQGIEKVDLADLRSAAELVLKKFRGDLGNLYETQCTSCGRKAEAKYFLWVKTCPCPKCGETVSLFPGYRIAEAVRHPHEVFHCPGCDALREVKTGSRECPECSADLSRGTASRGTATCRTCDHRFKFLGHLASPPKHRLVGIEYRCERCYAGVRGRQFKTPDPEDYERVARAAQLLDERRDDLVIPDDEIPSGDETDRLHRWGYRRYREMFSDRQLLALGELRGLIADIDDDLVRHALATVFSDFLRYQNLLCRYDTYALKCQDIFAVHGFPVGLVACENNVAGIPRVGSGSFVHFVEKYLRAKEYAQTPFETRYDRSRKTVVSLGGESAEATMVDRTPAGVGHTAWIMCGPSQVATPEPNSLDGAFTDPPYFDNVQYAELMDFCYVWLRTLVGDDPAFARISTRTSEELTGNTTLKRGIEQFAGGLSEVYIATARGLKPGAPLVFTYHHNDPIAYLPLVLSILDAGLTVTAVLPAPGEMTASLHINGTGSSVLDSVFVCRDRTFVAGRADAPETSDDPDALVAADVQSMAVSGYRCTDGDRACLRAGHLAGIAVRDLGDQWDATLPLTTRIEKVQERMKTLASGSRVDELVVA